MSFRIVRCHVWNSGSPSYGSPEYRSRRRGAAMVVALVTLLVVMLTAAALMRLMVVVHRQSRNYQNALQAQWLAEAGLSRAVARLAADAEYTGEAWQPEVGSAPAERGAATIHVKRTADQPTRRTIAVTAHFPDNELRRASARRELTITLPPAPPAAEENVP